jgi:hypothetical protein
MICSARRAVEAPSAASIRFISVADPSTLQDDVMDAMEDGEDVIGLDFLLSGGQPDIPEYVEALGWVQTVCSTPLVFRSNQTDLLQAMVEVYPGRAGIITETAGWYEGALRLV